MTHTALVSEQIHVKTVAENQGIRVSFIDKLQPSDTLASPISAVFIQSDDLDPPTLLLGTPAVSSSSLDVLGRTSGIGQTVVFSASAGTAGVEYPILVTSSTAQGESVKALITIVVIEGAPDSDTILENVLSGGGGAPGVPGISPIQAQSATIVGTITTSNELAGTIQAQNATISGNLTNDIELAGTIQAQSATMAGGNITTSMALSGTIQAQSATMEGMLLKTPGNELTFAGTIQSQSATMLGRNHFNVQNRMLGTIQAQNATIAGSITNPSGGPIIPVGDGTEVTPWAGTTVDPLGLPVENWDLSADFPCMQWTVVPYDIDSDMFYVGVNCHEGREIHSVFLAANQPGDSPSDFDSWLEVTEPSINPGTGRYEFWGILRCSDVDYDGIVEVRARCFGPDLDNNWVLQGPIDTSIHSAQRGIHSMFLVANAGNTITQEVIQLSQGDNGNVFIPAHTSKTWKVVRGATSDAEDTVMRVTGFVPNKVKFQDCTILHNPNLPIPPYDPDDPLDPGTAPVIDLGTDTEVFALDNCIVDGEEEEAVDGVDGNGQLGEESGNGDVQMWFKDTTFKDMRDQASDCRTYNIGCTIQNMSRHCYCMPCLITGCTMTNQGNEQSTDRVRAQDRVIRFRSRVQNVIIDSNIFNGFQAPLMHVSTIHGAWELAWHFTFAFVNNLVTRYMPDTDYGDGDPADGDGLMNSNATIFIAKTTAHYILHNTFHNVSIIYDGSLAPGPPPQPYTSREASYNNLHAMTYVTIQNNNFWEYNNFSHSDVAPFGNNFTWFPDVDNPNLWTTPADLAGEPFTVPIGSRDYHPPVGSPLNTGGFNVAPTPRYDLEQNPRTAPSARGCYRGPSE